MKVFLHTASLLALVIMIGVISVSPAGSITSLSGVHGCSSSLHLLSNAFLCISALPEFLAAEFQPSGSPVASQIFVGCFELLIFFTGLS
ncbi:MAG: hypothetical protein KDD64_01095, partial [Bdellovibrionales bacterium]|nr:hypothetical protein [Bdellovibrionales bacterium]